jgi:hypothetical protein
MGTSITDEIHVRLRRRNLRHTFHALKEEMSEGLTAREIEESLLKGFELVEDYPDDRRGHSCLILTWVKEKPVHIVCAPHEEALIIVTVYIPSREEWEQNFKTRRKRQ